MNQTPRVHIWTPKFYKCNLDGRTDAHWTPVLAGSMIRAAEKFAGSISEPVAVVYVLKPGEVVGINRPVRVDLSEWSKK